MVMLKQILQIDELHMIKLLIDKVSLQVRCDNKLGNPINTNIGVPQGDCLSPIFFIIYLANALKEQETTELENDITVKFTLRCGQHIARIVM